MRFDYHPAGLEQVGHFKPIFEEGELLQPGQTLWEQPFLQEIEPKFEALKLHQSHFGILNILIILLKNWFVFFWLRFEDG